MSVFVYGVLWKLQQLAKNARYLVIMETLATHTGLKKPSGSLGQLDFLAR